MNAFISGVNEETMEIIDASVSFLVVSRSERIKILLINFMTIIKISNLSIFNKTDTKEISFSK